jgi:hypothetical protein
MARRTLRLSKTGIDRAKRALRGKGLTQKDLTLDPYIASWGTINNFFNGRAIDHNIFKEICFHLELAWQDIYEPDYAPEVDATPPAPESAPAPASEPVTPHQSQDDLFAAVQQTAIAAREALTPRILERIPRDVVQSKYLPAIDRGINGGPPRVIPIIGAAGYGKSTILGDLYDHLTQTDTPWVGLILCSTLSLSVEMRSLFSYAVVAATFAPPAGHTTASAYPASMLEMGLGKSLCGTARSILDIVEHLHHHYGRGVLLIDTLDLVINRDFIPAFATVLRQLLDKGATIVFTCRDHEYNDYLEPTRERLIGLSERIDRHTVPNFTTAEIRAAAIAFFQKREPHAPERGQRFADNILALSADQRSLQEIIQNPLLLALLCDLFAAEGNVPPDLTVSKLYKRYWHEKIAYSRPDQSHFAPLAIAKENLCLTLSQALFDLSQTRLCESLYRDELGLQFTEIITQAYGDLFSEGVLDRLPSGKVHFFHQTLLEYAIAYWLTRQTAQSSRDALFTLLNQPDATLTKTHWLPVLRQLLTLVEPEAEFEQLRTQLDLTNVGLFGVVAFAAASRDRPDALRHLLPTALERGEAYQRRLRQALGVAARPLVENTWDMLLTLLAQSEHATAGNTAQLAGDLMARWWQPLKSRLPETLAAIAQRSPALASPEYQAQGDRALLLGWFLHPCLPFLQDTPEPELLSALQEHLHLLGYRTCAAVIHLHHHPTVSTAMQRSLLHHLLRKSVPDHEAVKTALWDFVAHLLPEQLASPGFPLGDSWSDILYQSFPDGWDLIQAKAVGCWAARDEALLVAILREFLSDRPDHLRQSLIALTASLEYGAGSRLLHHLQHLERFNPPDFKRVAPLLTRAATTLTPDQQESLAQWLQPYAQSQIEYLHPVLDVLADAVPIARSILEASIHHLPTSKQLQVRNQLLRFQPIQDHPPLSSLDKTSQKFLITVYRRQAATHPLALDRLLELSQCRAKEIALLASLDLDQVGPLHPCQLFPLLQSIFPGVRAHALTAIARLSEQDATLTPEALTTLYQHLRHEENQTVVRLLCNLTAQWVRHYHQVPPIALEILIEIPSRLSKQHLFEGGTARAMMDALKAIAQSEDPALDAEVLCQVVRKLLLAIHIIRVRNSESEMIDLLSAMNRIDQQFLATIIHTDCPALARQGWVRNIFAVVKTVRRVEGPLSKLLDEILNLDWCTPDIRSVILEIRGG